jgi:hypothetical protein
LWSCDLDVAEVEMGKLFEAGGLAGWVVGGDGANVGENITLKETAFWTGGGNLGDFGFWDALFMEEQLDGGIEGVNGVLCLD